MCGVQNGTSHKHTCTTHHFTNTTGTYDQCVMTRAAQFINHIQLARPFFGVIFLWSNFVFMAGTLFGLWKAFRPSSDAKAQEYEKLLDAGFESSSGATGSHRRKHTKTDTERRKRELYAQMGIDT